MYCQGKGADFYFIQETHATETDVTLWRSQWGRDIWFSFGTNRSAGVAILQGNFKGQVMKKCIDYNGRWIMLLIDINHSQFILVNIYGYNNKQMNNTLLSSIENKINVWVVSYPLAKIIWGGDFNMVLDESIDRYPPKDKKANELENVCNTLDLVDIWRQKHLNDITYTWSNKDRSLQSRIDLWLISAELQEKVESTSIEPAVFTDHNAITLKLNMGLRRHKTNSDYWKINSSLIQNEDFLIGTKQIIEKHWTQARLANQYGQYWELMKYEVRQLAVSLSKQISKANKQKENQIIDQIMNLMKNVTLSDTELIELSILQINLEQIYEKKAKGAFIRSRRKWLEQGEKCTKYFFNLEKRNNELSSISKLTINNQIWEDEKIISKHVADFYNNLYSKDILHEDHMDAFFQTIQSNVKKIDENFKFICDQKITVAETLKCIDALKDNKSPGNDGLTGEFYKQPHSLKLSLKEQY